MRRMPNHENGDGSSLIQIRTLPCDGRPCKPAGAGYHISPAWPPPRAGRGRSSGVEHNLAKVGVEGSNPFARSKIKIAVRSGFFIDRNGIAARWAHSRMRPEKAASGPHRPENVTPNMNSRNFLAQIWHSRFPSRS